MATYKGVRQAALDTNRIGKMGSEGNVSFVVERWVLPVNTGCVDGDYLESDVLTLDADSVLLAWQLVWDRPGAVGDSFQIQRRKRPGGFGAAGTWATIPGVSAAIAAGNLSVATIPVFGNTLFFGKERGGPTSTDPTTAATDKAGYNYRFLNNNAVVAPGAGNRLGFTSYLLYGNM